MGNEMSSVRYQLKRRKRALDLLDSLSEAPQIVNLVHYSCESFYDRPAGRSPRITSIAVRNWGTGQTSSFSIHQVAERKLTRTSNIEAEYDALELSMLEQWFEFAEAHRDHKWLHWNMRDINFGFAALEHRVQVLGGEAFHISESNRIDLARILIDVYGPGYVGHPRLERLMELNHVSTLNALTGAHEAKAFEKGDYVKLHQSTLRKVDVFVNILQRQLDGTLKTNATLKEMYGSRIVGVMEFMTDHWWFKLAGAAAIVITIVWAIVG